LNGSSRSATSVIRRIVAVLVLVPLAVVIIAFAVANRQDVTVSLDPFSAKAPAASMTLPLFVLIFVVVILGVVIGGVASRLRHGGWRRAAKRLEREVTRLHAEIDAHKRAAVTPTPEPVAPPERLKLRAPVR
jgi:uncharacterized integral membrane protein